MGDRVNIAVEDRGKRVYFYGHWSGYGAPEYVQDALKRRERWGHGSYLARIVFCEFVRGFEHDTLGFGISTDICDNEHPLIVVDVDKQQVRFEEIESIHRFKGAIGREFSFEDYCKLNMEAQNGWDAVIAAFPADLPEPPEREGKGT